MQLDFVRISDAGTPMTNIIDISARHRAVEDSEKFVKPVRTGSAHMQDVKDHPENRPDESDEYEDLIK